jgi:hypothetical protein
LLDTAGQFVEKQKGRWEHDDWEALLTRVADMGVPIVDETKRTLGNILESCKHFYAIAATIAPPEKKKPAKPRPKKKAAAKK